METFVRLGSQTSPWRPNQIWPTLVVPNHTNGANLNLGGFQSSCYSDPAWLYAGTLSTESFCVHTRNRPFRDRFSQALCFSRCSSPRFARAFTSTFSASRSWLVRPWLEQALPRLRITTNSHQHQAYTTSAKQASRKELSRFVKKFLKVLILSFPPVLSCMPAQSTLLRLTV